MLPRTHNNDYIEEHKLHQKYTESLIAASKLMERVREMNGGVFFAFRIALCCVVLDSMALPTQHLTRGSTRQLFRFLSSRVEEQTSRRSERHLASCFHQLGLTLSQEPPPR